eukprot:6172050-Pleurochrysis_carterae.AAC.1
MMVDAEYMCGLRWRRQITSTNYTSIRISVETRAHSQSKWQSFSWQTRTRAVSNALLVIFVYSLRYDSRYDVTNESFIAVLKIFSRQRLKVLNSYLSVMGNGNALPLMMMTDAATITMQDMYASQKRICGSGVLAAAGEIRSSPASRRARPCGFHAAPCGLHAETIVAKHSMLTRKCVSDPRWGGGCRCVTTGKAIWLSRGRGNSELATRRPMPCLLARSLPQPLCGSHSPRCRLLL